MASDVGLLIDAGIAGHLGIWMGLLPTILDRRGADTRAFHGFLEYS